jgi:hypothetical protein
MTVMSDDSSDTGTVSIVDTACNIVRTIPIRIFPVHAKEKTPMPKYMWLARASDRVNHVYEDFDEACRLWGEDQVSIAWAIGLDGCMAIDIDVSHDLWPDFIAEIVDDAVVNQTARGTHLYYRMPDKFQPGNGASNLPDSRGVDVRGAGGYVVIDGPDRPGLDPERLNHLRPFPRVEWLLPYGGVTYHASNQQVIDFANAHNGPVVSEPSWKGVLNMTDPSRWDPDLNGTTAGRHMTCLGRMTKFAEEAQMGLYPFYDAVKLLYAWWEAVTEGESGRNIKAEFNDMMPWAVGRALSKATTPSPTDDESQDESPTPSLIDGITPLLDPSFHPVDLEGVLDGTFIVPTPSILRRDDDRQALFYRGQVNGVHGDSGTGKGWVALYAAAQQLRAGNTVMLLDLEDVPSSIVDRLRKMHVSDDAIRERLIYIRPSSNFDRVAIEHLVAIVEARHPTLVIIDSLGEAFGLEGIDENHDSEVGPWLRAVPRRLADTGNGEEGPAVVILDHVTKVNDIPLHPSGSKRKRAAIGGAQYWAHSVVPFDAQSGGRLRLKCAKDRHGNFRRGEDVGDLVIRVDPIIGSWEATLYSPTMQDDSPTGRIERATNKVVDTLRILGKPVGSTALVLAMGGRKQDAYTGIEAAVADGLVIETKIDGKRRFGLPEWSES